MKSYNSCGTYLNIKDIKRYTKKPITHKTNNKSVSLKLKISNVY